MSPSDIVAPGDFAIDARAFSFSYPGANRAAVRGITFAVHRHEIFGFLGPSGAGKSTTQNVLIRLLDGFQGQIAVWGRTSAHGIAPITDGSASRSKMA